MIIIHVRIKLPAISHVCEALPYRTCPGRPTTLVVSLNAPVRLGSSSQPNRTVTVQHSPTAGVDPPDGHMRRHRRRRVEIYGTEPTRRSTRQPPSSANWIFSPGHEEHTPLYAVFVAAVSGEHRPHRDELVRVPKYYRDLHNYPYGKLFKEACRLELRSLIKKKNLDFDQEGSR
jgi:hypothetical protein